MIVGKVVGGIVGALVTMGMASLCLAASELERPKYSVVEKLRASK